MRQMHRIQAASQRRPIQATSGDVDEAEAPNPDGEATSDGVDEAEFGKRHFVVEWRSPPSIVLDLRSRGLGSEATTRMQKWLEAAAPRG